MSNQPQVESTGEFPPHVVNASVRKRLQQCFEHGSKLATQESYDHDYAHTLFAECVIRDPGNHHYVDAMLVNLQRKYNNNKKGSRLAMFSGKGPLKKAVAKKAWNEVLELGPDALKSNPWDILTLRSMADACAAYGYVDSELRYLRNALDARPKDPDVNRHCAISLARIGDFNQAIACWHRVEEARPNDPEPPEMINRLQLDKTHARTSGHVAGGRAATGPAATGPAASGHAASASGTSGGRAASAARDDATSNETTDKPKRREIELTERQKLEQILSFNPMDVATYLELAEIHINEDRLVEAQRVLSKGLTASGNNLAIQDRLDDVQILKVKNQLAVAEKRASAEGTADANNLVQQVRDELDRVELDVFRRRNQRHPNDLAIRYELAVRLKRVDNLPEAINQLQTMKDAPKFQVTVALEIAECLQRSKQFAKALQEYQRTAELATEPEHLGQKKTALYRAGLLANAVRDATLAVKCLSELVKIDPHYKDAAERLDKLR